ncbi:MAG TPA: hypothetical protein VHO71_04665 [Caproiciproducens sp.]|nr:hypothetical protein [Caproiciproducens sp.]
MKEKIKSKVQNITKRLTEWLSVIFLHTGDVIFLFAGILCLAIGTFLIYIPAGWISLGVCFIALAFFIGRKQAQDEALKAESERRR